MKEFKGTPGTWWASGREVGDFPMMNTKVALVDGESYEAVIANARLIAAAPELLNALKELVSWHSHPDEVCGMGREYMDRRIQRAKDLISKALGESQ